MPTTSAVVYYIAVDGLNSATGSFSLRVDQADANIYHQVYVSSFLTNPSSSTTIPTPYPDFGGIAAADWNMNVAASDAGHIANWNGSDILWRAILSVSGNHARDRLDIRGPVYNMNGDLVAISEGDFWDGSLQAPIQYNELGQLVSGNTFVWTGSGGSGVWSGDSCGCWTEQTGGATAGNALSTTPTWALIGNRDCALTARLYGISPPKVLPTNVVTLTDADGDIYTLKLSGPGTMDITLATAQLPDVLQRNQISAV